MARLPPLASLLGIFVITVMTSMPRTKRWDDFPQIRCSHRDALLKMFQTCNLEITTLNFLHNLIHAHGADLEFGKTSSNGLFVPVLERTTMMLSMSRCITQNNLLATVRCVVCVYPPYRSCVECCRRNPCRNLLLSSSS